jgi:hypothetical protein
MQVVARVSNSKRARAHQHDHRSWDAVLLLIGWRCAHASASSHRKGVSYCCIDATIVLLLRNELRVGYWLRIEQV